MLKIPLDVLKKLAAKPVVEDENDGQKFFIEFNNVLNDEFIAAKKKYHGNIMGCINAYENVKKGFLKQHCPPIEFISEGSSRAAYMLDGGLCLKIATNEAGKAQNRAEVRNMKSAEGLDIFPQLHQVGTNLLCILVDCVTPGNEDDAAVVNEFSKSIDFFGWRQGKVGRNPYQFSSPVEPIGLMLERIVDRMPGNVKRILENYIANGANDTSKEVAEMMLNPKNDGQKVLSRIAQWSAKNRKNLDPVDLENFENWGLAVRDGKILPVVLDAGFSTEVRDTFY